MLFRELGDRHGMVNLLQVQILVARREGHAPRVAAHTQQILALRRQTGTAASCSQEFDELAWVANLRGQPDQAARLLGAADALRQRLGKPVEPIYRSSRDQLVAEVRAALDHDELQTAWNAGATMTLDEVMTFAADEAKRT